MRGNGAVKTGGCAGERVDHGKLEEVAREVTAEIWVLEMESVEVLYSSDERKRSRMKDGLSAPTDLVVSLGRGHPHGSYHTVSKLVY